MKKIPQFLAIVTVLALSIISCGLFSAVPTASPVSPSPAQPAVVPPVVVPAPQLKAPPVPELSASQDALIQLYKNANPGVVAIRVLTPQGGALGSGFVIDNQGHIVTNYHVVEGETELEVAFSSGYKVRGKVIDKVTKPGARWLAPMGEIADRALAADAAVPGPGDVKTALGQMGGEV